MSFRLIGFLLILVLYACNGGDKTNQDAGNNSRESSLRAAMNAFPDSLLMAENLIQYYRDNGDQSAAIHLADSLANGRFQKNARIWHIKAILHFENEDTAQALKALEQTVAREPSPDYMTELGILYAHTGNPGAQAIADSLMATDADRLGHQSWYIRGLYHAAIGEKKIAINCFDQSIAQSLTFTEPYREKALVLYDMGLYEDALGVLDKCVALNNSFDEGHYYRGRCLEKLKRYDEAKEAYQTALLYDPGYHEAILALDRLEATQGQSNP